MQNRTAIIILSVLLLIGAGIGVVQFSGATEVPESRAPSSSASSESVSKRSKAPAGSAASSSKHEASPRDTVPAKAGDPRGGAASDEDFVVVSRSQMLDARMRANEHAAISGLRVISSAQAQLQSMGAIDTDQDGGGEYGWFGELTGVVPCRVARGVQPYLLAPHVLTRSFGPVLPSGNVHRTGYAFRMFLPGATVRGKTPGIAETTGASERARPLSDNAEILWAVYAWPLEPGKTGEHAFFINQEGGLIVTDNDLEPYAGESKVPAFDACFATQSAGDMGGTVVERGALANDGRVWVALDGSQIPSRAIEVGAIATDADLEASAKPGADHLVLRRGKVREISEQSFESSVQCTLEAVFWAQWEFQYAAVVDTDGDDAGEYGWFGELAGKAPCRAAAGDAPEVLRPALLSAAFGEVSSAGIVQINGYCYRMVLPGASAGRKVPGLTESASARPDHDACEEIWGVYAWPVVAGETGTKAFYSDKEHNVFETANTDHFYSGPEHAPAFDAALVQRGDMYTAVAIQPRKGSDGRVWTSSRP